MRMVLIEFRKMFGNIRLYLSAMCIAAVVLADMACTASRNIFHFCINELITHIYGDGFSLYVYVLGIIGGSFFYCMEEKNGSLSYQVHRGKVAWYAGAKTVSSFIGGFVTTLLGFFMGITIAFLILWIRYHNWDMALTGDGAYTYVDLSYNLVCLIFRALYVGLLSVIAFLTTTIYPDYFVGMIIPLLLHYTYITICNWVAPLPALDIRYIFNPDMHLFDTEMKLFSYAIAFSACICFIICRYSIYFIRRRLERG